MPAARPRRGKLFVVALAAIIFAETGYILGTTGIGWMLIEPLLAPRPFTFSDLLSSSHEAYVFYNGSVARADPRALRYNDAYVHVILYYPGVRLGRDSLRWIEADAAQRPVYVIPLPGVNAPVDPLEFYNALPKSAAHPVILVMCSADAVGKWLSYVSRKLQYEPGGAHVKIEIMNGEPVAVRTLA